jgi:hypothetical protein
MGSIFDCQVMQASCHENDHEIKKMLEQEQKLLQGYYHK